MSKKIGWIGLGRMGEAMVKDFFRQDMRSKYGTGHAVRPSH